MTGQAGSVRTVARKYLVAGLNGSSRCSPPSCFARRQISIVPFVLAGLAGVRLGAMHGGGPTAESESAGPTGDDGDSVRYTDSRLADGGTLIPYRPPRLPMEPLSLGIPGGVLDSLPEDDGTAAHDMKRAVEGIERSLNRAIEDSDDESEAAAQILDAVEAMEDRVERYHEFVPELRAWGQSPIYAIAWRNLYLELLAEITAVEWLASHLDRERNYRMVEDGIRFGGR